MTGMISCTYALLAFGFGSECEESWNQRAAWVLNDLLKYISSPIVAYLGYPIL